MNEYLELIIKESYAIVLDLKRTEENLYEHYSARRLMNVSFRLNTLRNLCGISGVPEKANDPFLRTLKEFPKYKVLYDELCKEYTRISELHEKTIISE